MSKHPQHTAFEFGPGESLTFDSFTGECMNKVAQPLQASSWLLRWKIDRRCRKNGGHWWHAKDSNFNFFCCQCGKQDVNRER